MMLNDRGCSPAPALALDLFERAAAKGHSGAVFALGAIYNGGHNLRTDRRTAQRWFRAAAEAGHGQAQMMLGRYLTRGLAGDIDLVEGRQCLERAVEQGITEAELDLGTVPAMPTPTRLSRRRAQPGIRKLGQDSLWILARHPQFSQILKIWTRFRRAEKKPDATRRG